MLIGTLAVSGILLFAASEVWGTEPYFVPAPLADVDVTLFGLPFIGPRLLVLIVGVVLAVGFFILARKAKVAVLFRASATDPYAATLMGVDVIRLDVITWTLAGALAGLAAVLVAPLVGFDVFFMTVLALRAFAAALLAGLTNVAGSLAAGLGIGIAESTLSRFSTQPGLADALLVALIVSILLIPRRGERVRGTA
jgi:branched-chain amino acid transport system permease protein